jgi:hypothetical protein
MTSRLEEALRYLLFAHAVSDFRNKLLSSPGLFVLQEHVFDLQSFRRTVREEHKEISIHSHAWFSKKRSLCFPDIVSASEYFSSLSFLSVISDSV